MSTNEFKIIISSKNVKKVNEKILDGVREFNLPVFGLFNNKQFTVYCEDENRNTIAGASCNIVKNVARIHYLWVSEKYRKRGLGSKILNEVEKYANLKKCICIQLDTYEFQAPKFYEKNGFKLIGIIPKWLENKDYHFYRKNLLV